MLTIHRVRAVRFTPDGEPRPRHALVVDGDRIEAIAPFEAMLAVYGEEARVREWDGELTPGRHEPEAAAILEAAYHPDPREAAELGTEPVTGEALAALGMTDARWGASARRGIQRLLAAGTTGLTGPFERPAVRRAVERSGIEVLPAPRPRTLVLGARADFAVFADADGAEGAEGHHRTCLATAIAGRLVHRRA